MAVEDVRYPYLRFRTDRAVFNPAAVSDEAVFADDRRSLEANTRKHARTAADDHGFVDVGVLGIRELNAVFNVSKYDRQPPLFLQPAIVQKLLKILVVFLVHNASSLLKRAI